MAIENGKAPKSASQDTTLRSLTPRQASGSSQTPATRSVRRSQSNLRLQTQLQAQQTGGSGPQASSPLAADVATMTLPQTIDSMHYQVTGSVREQSGNLGYKEIRTIPPYVLDRMSKKAHAGSADGTANSTANGTALASPALGATATARGVVVDTVNQGSKDPFIQTFKDDDDSTRWRDFLHTVHAPTAPSAPTTRLDGSAPRTTGYTDDDDDDAAAAATAAAIGSSLPNTDKTVADVFDSYKLDGHWHGEARLINCFKTTTSDPNGRGLADAAAARAAEQDYDTSSTSSSASSFQFKSKGAGEGGVGEDIEKGVKKQQHHMNVARYWIRDNKDTWKKRFIDSIMTNAYFPLVFRTLTMVLSVVTLALAVKLYQQDNRINVRRPSSPMMALCVQPFAIVYILYTTYDEFTSQPLGLRDPAAKIRLILLDLLFIIFGSANLSLAYQDRFDPDWVCKDASIKTSPLTLRMKACHFQEALTTFLFLILVSWCITFTISVFRVVHVVSNNRAAL